MIDKTPTEVYQFRILLKGVSPLIWRHILVTSDSTISDFHYAIQICMGWGDYHLNRFNIFRKDYGVYHDGGVMFEYNPEKVYLKDFQFRLNEKFLYEYNFNDGWEHEIRLEKIFPFSPKKTYPFCLDGAYLAPIEDCGGAECFMEMINENSPWAIEARIQEIKEENEEEDWDNEELEYLEESLDYWSRRHKFDCNKINRQLDRYFNSGESDLTVEEVQDED